MAEVDAADTAKHVTLGDRMKEYEAQTAMLIDPKLPWMVRLDGHKFSSYTRQFKRPFDERIHNCMTAACKALLISFNPTTVFTCSDEITLVFPALEGPESTVPISETADDADATAAPSEQKRTLMFLGRIQKIATLMASLASVAFDRELRLQEFAEDETNLKEYVESTCPYFDARIFNISTLAEIANNLLWRSHYDYRRNSISQLARSYYSAAQLHKLNSGQLLEMLKTEKGVDWEALPGRFKYGSFFKRELYTKKVEVKGALVEAQRTRIVELSFQFNKADENSIKFLTSKYLPEDYAVHTAKIHDK